MNLLVVNPETWTWGNTLAVTALGFGIVLVLLFSLVFILKLFGWTMQKMESPKTPKAPKAPQKEQPIAPKVSAVSAEPTDEGTKAAIAMAIAASDNEDAAAIAMALYLSKRAGKHDEPTAMIAIQARETAWNTKSIGMNNQGF